jgi:large subunit ribosomal protein L18
MSAKNESRLRRARRARARMRGQGVNRLSVHRTPRHIYAQVIAPAGDRVLVSASTLDSELRGGKAGNIEAAAAVGKLVALRAREAGIETVAFDRAGYKYHGRVKALADAAREHGLQF